MDFSIKPTIYFFRENNTLYQMYEIEILNSLGNSAWLEVNLEGFKKFVVRFDKIKSRNFKTTFKIPDFINPLKAEFVLHMKDVVKNIQLILQPQRKWEIYLLHHSHVDIGFTDIQTKIYEQHFEYVRDAIQYCKETKHYPKESQFKWNCEVTWTVENFLKRANSEQIKDFLHFIKTGQIEVMALYVHLTELYSYEELIRMVMYAGELKKKYGIQFKSAMSTDVPGITWAMPQILNNIGVKYLSKGTNPDHAYPVGVDRPFYWEGPGKGRLLVWECDPYGPAYMEGTELGFAESIEKVTEKLPVYLQSLQNRNHPYSFTGLRLSGINIDNAPPKKETADVAKEWNARWAYPKIIVSTATEFFRKLEKDLKDNIPAYQLAWPDWWSDGYVSSPLETGLNRTLSHHFFGLEFLNTVATKLRPDINYPKKLADQTLNNMIFFNEHTWGSRISTTKPYSIHSLGQWAIKSSFAYQAAIGLIDLVAYGINSVALQLKKKEENTIIVMNPSTYPKKDILFLEINKKYYSKDVKYILVDESSDLGYIGHCMESNETYPYVMPFSFAENYRGDEPRYQDLIVVAFESPEIPPMGYKTFYLKTLDRTRESLKKNRKIKVTPTKLENQFYKIIVDPKTGAIRSIFDKEIKLELVDLNSPHQFNQLIHEKCISPQGRVAFWQSDYWSHHRSPQPVEFTRNPMKEIQSIFTTQAEVYGKITIIGKIPGCKMVQMEIVLYPNMKRIDIFNTLHKETVLDPEAIYFCFPFYLNHGKFHLDQPGSPLIPGEEQLPGSALDWYMIDRGIQISNEKYKILWASREAPKIQPYHIRYGEWSTHLEHENETFFSEVYNNYWYTNCKMSAEGKLYFRYIITSQENQGSYMEASRFFDNVQNPLYARFCPNGTPEKYLPELNYGIYRPLKELCPLPVKKPNLPAEGSFITINSPNIRLLAFKPAEQGNKVILRMTEFSGQKSAFTVSFPFFKIKRAEILNIAEEKIENLPLHGNKIKLILDPWEFVTIGLDIESKK